MVNQQQHEITVLPELSFKQYLEQENLLSRGLLDFFRLSKNGANSRTLFKDVWLLYKRNHLSTISESSSTLVVFRGSKFFPPLFELPICAFTPQIVTEYIRFNKNFYIQKRKSKRFNFSKELKDLKAIFNWYKDTIDFTYSNPLRPQHFKQGVIKEIPYKKKEISFDELKKFLNHLSQYYRDIAIIQFFCGARIGEILGLHWKNINFESRILTIQEVAVWIKGKPRIKSKPKNGQPRIVFINNMMLEIFKRHSEACLKKDIVFHRNGEIFKYITIHKQFNKAWKKSGLNQFSGTHQMRYAAAQISRKILGSIDAAKSITGHKSTQLAEKYSQFSNIDLNRLSVEALEKEFISLKLPTSEVQRFP